MGWNIDKNLALSQVKRCLLLSIIVGLVCSFAYCAYFNVKYGSIFREDVKIEDRLLRENYSGDYLTYKETTRCAMWKISFKDEAFNILLDTEKYDFSQFLQQHANLLIQRLNSITTAQSLYEGLKSDPVFKESRISSFDLIDVFGGAFLHSTEMLGINTVAPKGAEGASNLNNEQLVYLRDLFFDAFTEILSDDNLYADLPICLTRVDSSIENGISEQKLIREALRNPVAIEKRIVWPKKAMILFFLIGFTAVEGIVVLRSVSDKTVKSVTELCERTDLTIIENITITDIEMVCNSEREQEPTNQEEIIYLYTDTIKDDKVGLMADYIQHKYRVSNVKAFSSDLDKEAIVGSRLILPIIIQSTNYKQLKKASRELSLQNMNINAIVIDN